MLAVGSKDNLIHILSVDDSYRHVATCKGHTTSIKNMDFSSDGKVLQTTDSCKEILYWDVFTGQRISNASQYRDLSWHTWTCLYGWPVQGIYNSETGSPAADSDLINCVNRSPHSTLVVAGTSNTVSKVIKLFNYPCLADAIPIVYGGHTSPVLDVAFNSISDHTDGDGIVSAGGNDSCLFQWKVINH